MYYSFSFNSSDFSGYGKAFVFNYISPTPALGFGTPISSGFSPTSLLVLSYLIGWILFPTLEWIRYFKVWSPSNFPNLVLAISSFISPHPTSQPLYTLQSNMLLETKC